MLHPMTGQTNATLYVSNLYEKRSASDLVDALRCIFERYGPVLDIVARRTHALRGQAFVVFENPEHDYPQRILYLRDGDELTARIEGTAGGVEKSSEWTWTRGGK